jgi:beta-glucanase (GH16 family)
VTSTFVTQSLPLAQVYASSAVSLHGGELTIQSSWHPKALRVLGNDSVHYTTGRLQTQNKHSWGPFGQFEATVRVSAAHGTNNAVWLMPQSAAKSYTEFDIMECLGRNTSVGHGTYHYGAPSGPLHHRSGGEFIDAAGLSGDFHTYGLLWTRLGLWWYVDGTIYHHFELPSNATTPSVFFILQSNIGSNWAGKPVASDYPAKMVVDRVRVFGLRPQLQQ